MTRVHELWRDVEAARSVGPTAPPLGLVHPVTSDASAADSEEFAGINRRRRLSRMRRGVRQAASLLQARPGFRTWAAFVTLTYAGGVSWSPRHVSLFLKHARAFVESKGAPFRYVWVMELTRAGVPHFHVVVFLPFGIKLPKPDDAEWWRQGSSNIERARCAVAYICKYASKGTEADLLPRGARLFGYGGLTVPDRVQLRWHLLPRYVRELFCPADRAIRAEGGGWISRATGEWHPARTAIRAGPLITWAAASPEGAS